MLDFLRPLFGHQEWADGLLLEAVAACPAAKSDAELRAMLFHVVVVQRFFLAQCTGAEFDMESELRAPDAWEDLAALFRRTHEAELSFVSSACAAEMDRVLELPQLEGIRPTIAQALTQVVMHSQNHRGQCLTRLRKLGGTPPTLDYLIWLRDGPGSKGQSK